MDKQHLTTGPAVRRTTIGGQALLEGLMMIGPEKTAMTVRLANGLLYREERPTRRYGTWGQLPLVRGSVRLIGQLMIGMSALSRSADLSELDRLPPDADPAGSAVAVAAASSTPFGRSHFSVPDGSVLAADPADAAAVGRAPDSDAAAELPADAGSDSDRAAPAAPDEASPNRSASAPAAPDPRHPGRERLYMTLAMCAGLLLGVGIFVFLPNLLTSGVTALLGLSRGSYRQTLLYNLIEGVLRVAILLLYMWLTTRSKSIARTWQYHGAEHKTIACYEHGMPLTVEHVRSFSRFHPRCGTSFLFLVVLLSSVLFSFFGWHTPLVNIAIRLLMIPVVAGLAFELQRFAGARTDTVLGRIISAPGLWLQRLTTREPDDAMLQVAIDAMQAVIPEQAGSDAW